MGKERRLNVRVDGGRKIGMGHIFRCLSLLRIAVRFFDDINVFIECPEKSTVDLITNEGFQVKVLNSSIDFFLFLEKDDVVLLDGYHFTEEYEQQIKNIGCKIITIDDLQHRKFYADILINHTPGINAANYLTAPYTKIYLGLKYALIRKEFIEARNKKMIPKRFSKALVCFGGADPENYTLHYYLYLKNKLSIPLSQINLVVGSSYPFLNSLTMEIRGDDLAVVWENIEAQNLIELLYNCDFAVVSASTISIECMKIGIPLYLVKTAENQTTNFNYLLENGYAAETKTIPQYTSIVGENMLKKQAMGFGTGSIEKNLENVFKDFFY